MLNDVLGELREVGQVDLLPTHQRFTFAQPVCNRPRRQGYQKEDGTQHAGRGVVRRRVRPPSKVHEDLLGREPENRGDGG